MLTSILSLGTDTRAVNAWLSGCRDTTISQGQFVVGGAPRINELQNFFKNPSDWIYFAGHHLSDYLCFPLVPPNTTVTFLRDRVELQTPKGSDTISKLSFRLNPCRVTFWGGCSICARYSGDLLQRLFQLFGPHVLIGYSGSTGVEMTMAMLGSKVKGWKIHHNFFANLQGRKVEDPAVIRDAWLNAALEGHGGTKIEDQFRVFDPNGQEWMVKNKKFTKGRNIPTGNQEELRAPELLLTRAVGAASH